MEAFKAYRKRYLPVRLKAGETANIILLVKKTIHRLVKVAGVPPMTIHGPRHCHASFLLLKGIHPKVVSERPGHSNVSITLTPARVIGVASPLGYGRK